MGRRSPPIDFQQMMPVSPLVKKLIIANVVIWFLGIVVVEQYFLSTPWMTLTFGLVPIRVIKDFFLWQPLTYLFIHAANPLHVIFNMLLLYWMGSSLERLWGTRFFALFYFVSGVGGGILYTVAIFVYSLVTSHVEALGVPVVGASAALFGLLVAYGMYFGEQTVLFMFFFPMKAKYFTAILGGIEVVLVLNNGPVQGKVANLAHVGGLITGYVFLKIWHATHGRGGGDPKSGKTKKAKKNNLRLVVNNDEMTSTEEKPKYWN